MDIDRHIKHFALYYAHSLPCGCWIRYCRRAERILPEHKLLSCATATCLLMAIPHFPYSKVSTKISHSSQNIWGSIKVTSGEMRCVAFITIRLPGVRATDIAHNRCCSGVAQVFQVERHQSIAAVGNLLRAGYIKPLAFLQRGDELAGIEQRFVSACIQPSITTTHNLDFERALFQIHAIQVSDFQFAPR